MQIDASLPPVPFNEASAIACAAEALGFDAIWATETMHDPFLPGAMIADRTRQIQFGTAVAIAFARSPTTLAHTAWDLAQASEGRFILGLGTQVRAHVERRFGMPWPDSVTGKLREMVGAMRAIWRTWQTGAPLRFQGEYYRLNLMSPFFNPGPISYPEIPIYIAGVNTGLAKLAGETANGFLVHPFHTPRYLSEVLLPAIEAGAQRAERGRQDVKISVTAFVISDPGEELFVRQQISFYASTPTYKSVMALHGWEKTAEELTSLAGRGAWGDMVPLITDEMLDTFAVRAAPEDLGAGLRARYDGLADRLALYLPFVPGQRDSFWQGLLTGLKA
jgi:probable F420-dependent oxidoreductase